MPKYIYNIRYITMNQDYVYSDLTSNMNIDELGNFEVLHDADVIIQSLRTIFATITGERVRNPIGSVLMRLLFEPMNDDTAVAIKSVVHQSVMKYEPRVNNIKVSITPNYDDSLYEVYLQCDVRKLTKKVILKTNLRSMYS